MVILLGLVLCLCWSAVAQAATVNAASCSMTDVQSAINTAAVGDTVRLPPCTQVGWTGTVTITKRIILEGAGIDTTVIRRSAVNAGLLSNPMFQVTNVTGFEMRQMTINGTADTHPNTWEDTALALMDCSDFRVHHMKFTFLGQGILVRGNPLVQRGLIDHNTFEDLWFASASTSSGYGVHVVGNGVYLPLSLGTAQNVFVEDNTHTRGRHAIASNNGARYVYRYNTMTAWPSGGQVIDAHGDHVWTVGSRQWEIYQNTISSTTSTFAGVFVGGGDGVIFNNVISQMSGTPNRDIRLHMSQPCGGTYPMDYQIREAYVWQNTRPGGSPSVVSILPGCEFYLQQGRDYFLLPRPGYVAYQYPHPLQGGTAPAPDLTAGLRLHLAFDEGFGTIAEDSTTFNQDGTLSGGATWGPATLGASAVLLDGSDDQVLVTGLLTSPPAVTLAGWVLPTSYGTSGGSDVISLGNVVMLRVTATEVKAHAWNGSTFATLSGPRPASATWQHVAYTFTVGAQRLYVNGEVVASGSSGAALSYVGQGSHTLIGTHGNAATTTRFGGRLDDVRVYTRALTATDMAGLAILEDPAVLSVQVTAPTTSPSFSVSSALLAEVGGVASDDVGVTGVTGACPTCTPPSVAALCTPSCGAATTFTTWTMPGLLLAPGSNLITVTATDASGSRQDTLTVTYTPPAAPTCTHYASVTGGGNGLAQGSPFQVGQFWPVATPGAGLCLLSGTYAGAQSMVTPPAGLSGTASLPITVRALHDGEVLLDGEHARNPVVLGSTNTWWVIQGLNARRGLTAVYQFLGSNNRGSRVIGWDTTTGHLDAVIFEVTGTDTLVEDCAGWGANARIIFQGSQQQASPGSGYRRCWGEWNDHPEGGITGGATFQPGVGQVLENVLGTVQRTGQ